MLIELEDKVFIALITAVAGIITSILASLLSLRTSKSISKLKISLEKQKDMTIEYLKAYIKIELEESSRTLNAFKNYLKIYFHRYVL